jgi:acyl carrier protein
MDTRPIDRDEVSEAVCASIADMLCLSPAEIERGTTLADLGADSFQLIELASRLDGRFGITLPKRYAMSGRHTVDALIHAVAEQVQALR